MSKYFHHHRIQARLTAIQSSTKPTSQTKTKTRVSKKEKYYKSTPSSIPLIQYILSRQIPICLPPPPKPLTLLLFLLLPLLHRRHLRRPRILQKVGKITRRSPRPTATTSAYIISDSRGASLQSGFVVRTGVGVGGGYGTKGGSAAVAVSVSVVVTRSGCGG